MSESRRYELGTEIPVHKVTVDVVIPLRTKAGRLLEEAKGRITTMPLTEGNEYVTLNGVVTYAGRKYGGSVRGAGGATVTGPLFIRAGHSGNPRDGDGRPT